MEGDELLAQEAHGAITTPDGIEHPAEPAGASVLFSALQSEMGTHEQDMQIASLEAFFNHQRTTGQSLLDYMTMRRAVYDGAEATAGLVLNPVAKSFLLLRSSGISEKQKYDFRLQISGDLSRFEDLCQIMLRFANQIWSPIAPLSQPWPISSIMRTLGILMTGWTHTGMVPMAGKMMSGTT